ncbi:MAG: SH3 domain-containing protein [Acidobacteria bacterium]|nr:SH3 domain-containing protein [Acidobacteriota bacterium]
MKRKLIGVFLLSFAILLASINVSAQKERQVFPVDEGKKNASFESFREKLIEAVKKRDAKYVVGILDPAILNSFGGDGGIEEFKEMWKIDSPASELWDELLIVLTNGGSFFKEDENNLFCAPYSFKQFPEDLDAFEYQLIFDNNVNLRVRPDLKAETVGQLSYNVVKVDYENSVADKNKEGEYFWLNVETLGGKKGFVSAKFVRSSVDYRACFEKKNGKWKMTTFVAGD